MKLTFKGVTLQEAGIRLVEFSKLLIGKKINIKITKVDSREYDEKAGTVKPEQWQLSHTHTHTTSFTR